MKSDNYLFLKELKKEILKRKPSLREGSIGVSENFMIVDDYLHIKILDTFIIDCHENKRITTTSDPDVDYVQDILDYMSDKFRFKINSRIAHEFMKIGNEDLASGFLKLAKEHHDKYENHDK